MKASRIAVLVLAVAAAGGAFLLATGQKPAPVQTAVPQAAVPVPQNEVLVAARDFPVGTVLGDADLAWQVWPQTGTTPGMIVKVSEPKALDDIKGSIARGGFFQGEPIHREKLIKGGSSGFMSAILPMGMRAVAINIDSNGANSAGGFILPNDRVDVVRTYHDDTNKGANPNSFTTETILSNIRVLAIGQNVQEKNGQSVVVGSNATLELDPVQAETVILGQRTGQLSLTLRSILDANNNTIDPKADKKTLTVVRFGTAVDGAAQ